MADAPIDKRLALLEALFDKLGPDLVRALSPTEGLQVSSHVFQAIEQEGRWKTPNEYPGRSLYRADPAAKRRIRARGLDGPAADEEEANLASALIGRLQSRTVVYDRTVLTLLSDAEVGSPSQNPDGFFETVEDVGRYLEERLQEGVGINRRGPTSSAVIGAKFWADGQEIWSGTAGLTQAAGFGSVFGNQAGVVLAGTSHGNYLPASYFLSFTGFVNYLGPQFFEFRGGVFLKADGELAPAFCEKWSRGGRPQDVEFSREKGYVISPEP